MTRVVVSIIFVLGISASVFAQTWDGFYVGGNAGGVLERTSANTSTVFSSTGYFATTSVPAINTAGSQKIGPNGFTGGGQVGYNHQSGSFFVGGEADFGALHASDTATTSTTYPCCAPTAFTVTQSVKTRWLFTARPRVGFAGAHALVYGTGGLAVTDLNYQAVFTDTFANAHENGGVKENRAGWTVGAGFEVRGNTSSHWSIKGEYLYADFGRATTTSTNLIAFPTSISFPSNVFTHSADLRVHIIRGGVNYRF